MSDVVLVSIITSVTTIVTLLINTRQNRKIAKKVDTYHKEVNGKMSDLLVTTKALGNAEGKAEQKKESL